MLGQVELLRVLGVAIAAREGAQVLHAAGVDAEAHPHLADRAQIAPGAALDVFRKRCHDDGVEVASIELEDELLVDGTNRARVDLLHAIQAQITDAKARQRHVRPRRHQAGGRLTELQPDLIQLLDRRKFRVGVDVDDVERADRVMGSVGLLGRREIAACARCGGCRCRLDLRARRRRVLRRRFARPSDLVRRSDLRDHSDLDRRRRHLRALLCGRRLRGRGLGGPGRRPARDGPRRHQIDHDPWGVRGGPFLDLTRGTAQTHVRHGAVRACVEGHFLDQRVRRGDVHGPRRRIECHTDPAGRGEPLDPVLRQLVELEDDAGEGGVVADPHVDDARGLGWLGEQRQGYRRKQDRAGSKRGRNSAGNPRSRHADLSSSLGVPAGAGEKLRLLIEK